MINRSSNHGVPDLTVNAPIMMVMIPVGSGLSATWQLTATTMKIVAKELRRGYKMLQQVEVGRASWADVHKDVKFFTRHRHYLQIDVLAANEAVFAAWIGWVQQKLEDLVPLFQTMSSNIVTLRPWPKWISFKDADWACSSAVLVGLHLERGSADGPEGMRRSFDLREPIVKFLERISQWPQAEQYERQFELIIKHVRVADLAAWLQRGCSGASGTAISGLAAGSSGGGQFEDTADAAEDDGEQQVQNCSV